MFAVMTMCSMTQIRFWHHKRMLAQLYQRKKIVEGIIAVVLDAFEEGFLAKLAWEWLRNKEWRRKCCLLCNIHARAENDMNWF